MNKDRPPVYYSEYLQLDKILNAQLPESDKEGIKADDEMLFIIIHQVYELWFKQVLHEVNIVRNIFISEEVPNSSPDMYNAVHRLSRVREILKLLVQQINIIETMTPLDFLDFRDLLKPASGFQSIQFKILEASLGLAYDDRFGKQYYLSQLTESDIQRVKDAEAQVPLITLVNNWLERMPFSQDGAYWNTELGFWEPYRVAYQASLSDTEMGNMTTFDQLFIDATAYDTTRKLSQKASRNALFIMLYRDYPLLHLPFEFLTSLLDIDDLLSNWRHRHIQMVQKTIGNRVGTGGSTGAGYLKAARDSHHIFKEMADLTSFLLPRNELPILEEGLVKDLCFIK